jgi:tetratricopeptide (TPR) repeat protein
MADAALRSAAKLLGQSEEAHATVVRRLVHTFYASAMRDRVVLQELVPHIAIAVSGKLDQLRDAVDAVPEAVHERERAGQAALLLYLPRPATEIKSPTALLRADNAVVSFTGRQAELTDLLDWCSEGEDRIRLRLYVGQGGQGKTRLTLELARRLGPAYRGEAWTSGLLRDHEMRNAPDEALRRLVSSGNVLVIVDYAETRRDDVARLLQAAEDADVRRLRIVLLARSAGDWWDALLRMRGRARDLLEPETTEEILLGPLVEASGNKTRLLQQSAEAFAQVKCVAVPDTSALTHLPGLDTALDLQIAALLAVLGDTQKVPGERLMGRLLDREQAQWEHMMRLAGVDGAAAVLPGMRHAMAAITLLGGVHDSGAGHAALGLCPTLVDVPRHQRDAVLRVLSDLYGPAFRDSGSIIIEPLEPDRIGEALVDAELSSDITLLNRLCDAVVLPAVSDGDANPPKRMLTVLTRLAQRRPDAARWLDRTFADDTRALALAPAAIAVAMETGDPIGQRLAMALDRAAEQGHWREAIAALEVSHPATALREVAVTVRAVDVLNHASVDSEEARSKRAGRLHNFSFRLGAVGRREEALAAIDEAVRLYRALAEARPDAFTEDLAQSLNNLAARRAAIGMLAEALAASEEAVDLYRTLLSGKPNVVSPGLAMALTTLSVRLGAVGRTEDALAANDEVVVLCRALANAEPETYTSGLAGALNNASFRRRAVGLHGPALDAIEEAIDLYRRLADADPDAFMPDLARALTNLPRFLESFGRPGEALANAEKGIKHYRTLVKARPEVFNPDLARSLHTLARCLNDVGRSGEAVEAIDEAIALARDLAAARPSVFAADLARSLKASADLRRTSDLSTAITLYREAIQTLEPVLERCAGTSVSLMRALVVDYRATSAATNITPDNALLAPVEAILATIPPDPPQTSP